MTVPDDLDLRGPIEALDNGAHSHTTRRGMGASLGEVSHWLSMLDTVDAAS